MFLARIYIYRYNGGTYSNNNLNHAIFRLVQQGNIRGKTDAHFTCQGIRDPGPDPIVIQNPNGSFSASWASNGTLTPAITATATLATVKATLGPTYRVMTKVITSDAVGKRVTKMMSTFNATTSVTNQLRGYTDNLWTHSIPCCLYLASRSNNHSDSTAKQHTMQLKTNKIFRHGNFNGSIVRVPIATDFYAQDLVTKLLALGYK
jgi:hypothetical protein